MKAVNQRHALERLDEAVRSVVDAWGAKTAGDRAEHLILGVADRKKPDILRAHSASGRLHRVGRSHALYVALHEILTQHVHLL